MQQKFETISPKEYQAYGITDDLLIRMLRKMLLIREFENAVEDLYLRKGLLMGPAHLYTGMEAVAAGISEAFKKGDVFFSNHRGHGHAIAFGLDPKKLMAEMFGNADGILGGVSGSMHIAIEPSLGAIYSSAIVGSQVPIAVGAAYALKLKSPGSRAFVFFGDGAVTTGAFWEGLVMARFLRTPIYFICEDNQYAEYTRTDYTIGTYNIDKITSSLGVQTKDVDGNDPLSVLKAAKDLEPEVLQGPVAIHAFTYRFSGHSVTDPATYRSSEELEEWRRRDPIEGFSRRLLNEGVIDENLLSSLKKEVKDVIEEAVQNGLKGASLPFDEIIKLGGDP